MALALSTLTSGQSSVDATSRASASITPTVGRRYYAAVCHYDADASAEQPTCAGNSLTWTVVRSRHLAPGDGFGYRMTVFEGVGTPTTGAVTFTMGDTQGAFGWWVGEATECGGVRNSADNVTNSGTAIVVTLPAFGSANNMAVGFIYQNLNQALTEGSGFTEVIDIGNADLGEIGVERKLNDTTVDWSWASTGPTVAIAIELRQLVTVTGTAVGSGTGAGTIVGTRKVSGTAVGSGTGAGVVVGKRTVLGAAAGSGTGAGTATGLPTVFGNASGSGTGSGTASGDVETPAGTGIGLGSGTGSGAATGLVTHLGTASGSGLGTGSATGGPTETGTASGTGVGDGTAIGLGVTPVFVITTEVTGVVRLLEIEENVLATGGLIDVGVTR